MTSLLLTIFFTISCLFLFSLYIFDNIKSKKIYRRINKVYFLFSLFLVFGITSIVYIQNSNYWIGDNLTKKIVNSKNIEQLNPDEALIYYIQQLEKEFKKKPNDFNIIKNLAEAKLLLGNFSEAYKLYSIAKKNTPNDIELMIGEANSRLFLENGNATTGTIKLFDKILERDKDNLLALLIVGDYSFKENNLLNAKNLYLKLLKLLKKDSKEYLNIKNKIALIEEKIDGEKKR